MLTEVRKGLEKRQRNEVTNRQQVSAKIARPSVGVSGKPGDLVLVEKGSGNMSVDRTTRVISSMRSQCTPGKYPKVSDKQGLSIKVIIEGRRVRRHRVATSAIKWNHPRRVDSRCPLASGLSQHVLSTIIGLANPPNESKPLCTLVDRKKTTPASGATKSLYGGRQLTEWGRLRLANRDRPSHELHPSDASHLLCSLKSLIPHHKRRASRAAPENFWPLFARWSPPTVPSR